VGVGLGWGGGGWGGGGGPKKGGAEEGVKAGVTTPTCSLPLSFKELSSVRPLLSIRSSLVGLSTGGEHEETVQRGRRLKRKETELGLKGAYGVIWGVRIAPPLEESAYAKNPQPIKGSDEHLQKKESGREKKKGGEEERGEGEKGSVCGAMLIFSGIFFGGVQRVLQDLTTSKEREPKNGTELLWGW